MAVFNTTDVRPAGSISMSARAGPFGRELARLEKTSEIGTLEIGSVGRLDRRYPRPFPPAPRAAPLRVIPASYVQSLSTLVDDVVRDVGTHVPEQFQNLDAGMLVQHYDTALPAPRVTRILTRYSTAAAVR
jgi:hypothetical protein